MMNVFAFFDPADPHPLTRLWIKSWAARGWRPRLIIPSETEGGLSLRQVANRRGGGLVVTAATINFSRSTRKKNSRATKWPDVTGDVVNFERGPLGMERSEDDVLHCGRPLNAS
jgi:hypothetical protein